MHLSPSIYFLAIAVSFCALTIGLPHPLNQSTMRTFRPAALSKRINIAALPPPSSLPKTPPRPNGTQNWKNKEGDGPEESIEEDWREHTDFDNPDVEAPENPEVPETSDDICEQPNPPPRCGASTAI